MSVKIIYQDIAAGADADAAVTAENTQPFSNPQFLPLGLEAAPEIASLELNQWVLDGSKEIEDGQPVRYWSSDMSDGNGLFEAPPTIQIDFSHRYTSPGIYLHFDQQTGEYCSRVTIQWWRGISLLNEATFFPNGPDYFCGAIVEAYDALTIKLEATSIPYRYAKLSQIVFGVSRVFLRDELRNVRITAEASIISSEIAVNTLDFTLDSSENVEYMFQLKQPISAYDGDNLIGVFYMDDSTHRAAGLYDVSCIDAIGVLDEDTFPAGMYTGYSARTLIEEIIGGHFELDMDASVAASSVTGYLPPGTRREALQQVAFAIGAVVDTSGTDKVRVYHHSGKTPARFKRDRVYINGTVGTSAIVTAVKVTAHTYSLEGEGSDTVEVDGKTYYHTTSVTAISNPKSTASDKQNVIEVKNATLINPSNVFSAAQRLYNYYMLRQLQKVQIVVEKERPADRVAMPTPWGTVINGYITRMNLVLSGITAADCEIVGTEVRTTGDPEARYSGEFYAGEV